jgi:hypothetical protein
MEEMRVRRTEVRVTLSTHLSKPRFSCFQEIGKAAVAAISNAIYDNKSFNDGPLVYGQQRFDENHSRKTTQN